MKYWFFNGNDVVGPFTLKELAKQKSFSETSLVCPENFSDDGDHWQVAVTFAELKPLFTHPTDENNEPATLEKELDTLLKERSPLAFDETPSEGPGLQIPQKPAKPGPIEDYFNRIKGEDLGDILGIPNPNDNSDMDLAHALEKQLAKTASTRREKQESSVDEQTVQELTQAAATHHVATLTEVFGPTAPATAPVATLPKPSAKATPESSSMPTVEPVTLPVLAQDPVVTKEEPVTPAQKKEKEDLVSQPQKATQPQSAPMEIIPDPALLRREKVEVNSVRARLKQTQEMKDFLHQTQNTHLKRQSDTQRRVIVMLLAVLAITGGLLLTLQLKTTKKPAEQPLPTPKVTAPAEELLAEVPPTPVVPKTPPTQEQKAIAIVQNYSLGAQRGTLADYLSRIYKTQLAQGYIAAWEAEPLYKNAYVVKYRLTKTRKEPIIYVFQADVAQGKLTGALNNISLDLVGKIN